MIAATIIYLFSERRIFGETENNITNIYRNASETKYYLFFDQWYFNIFFLNNKQKLETE